MTTNIPTTQKAWRAHRRGKPRDVLSLDEIPVPKPGPKQALIKVEAAALNPIGYKLMLLLPNFIAGRPKAVEYDFTGTVVQVGSSISYAIGDKVWGNFDLRCTQGALSQYLLVTEEDSALVPRGLSLEQAAAIPCAGLSSQQAIYQHAKVQPGQSVLIVGGSTSVGMVMIQMLRQLGASVSVSCSTRNADFVKSLGANVVYDYTISPVQDQLRANPPSPKFDAIIDCVGGHDVWRHCKAYLAPSGTFVAIGSGIKSPGQIPGEIWDQITKVMRPAWLGGVGRKRIQMITAAGKANLQAVNEIISKGDVVPIIDSVYEFEDVFKAYDRIMSNRARGKLVVHVP